MTRDYKVFIGNIPFDCRESDIHSFFKGYGRHGIRQVVLKNNYGFCEFLDYEDAKAAVNDLNGERLLGKWRWWSWWLEVAGGGWRWLEVMIDVEVPGSRWRWPGESSSVRTGAANI